MKNTNKLILSGAVSVLAAAGAVIAAPAEPANASVEVYRSCSTTGAFGNAQIMNWTSSHADLELLVTDRAADGHHVAIRFLSRQAGYPVHYWPWHHDYRGDGGTESWNTSASGSPGTLNYVGIQVAVMEGSRVIRSCTDWSN